MRRYPKRGFNDAASARPLPQLKPPLTLWDSLDPSGWAVASWLASPQVELDGRTPRQVLLSADAEQVRRVVSVAQQAAHRLTA